MNEFVMYKCLMLENRGYRNAVHCGSFLALPLHYQVASTPSHTLMSQQTASPAKLQSIIDVALDSYARQTGVDLTKHPSADRLQNCRSPEDIIQLLLERETAFKDYRDKYRNLIDRLRPVVRVVHGFSGVLGEAAGLVSS
jgi:fungal STAND N-terminal Goodbye domain